MVEPPHLRFELDDAHVSGRGFKLTKPADILLHAWRGDRYSCIHLVDVSPACMVAEMLPLPSSRGARQE